MSIHIERQVSSPHVRAIVDYWLALRGDRPAPQVTQVDPVDIPKKSLAYVLLTDLSFRPFRVRYRLVGTHSVELFGDYKGLYLDELGLPEGIDAALTADYAFAAWACQPVLGSYDWPKVYGKPAIVDYALLPLLEGDRVTRLLCAEHIGQHDSRDPLYPEDLQPRWRKPVTA